MGDSSPVPATISPLTMLAIWAAESALSEDRSVYQESLPFFLLERYLEILGTFIQSLKCVT